MKIFESIRDHFAPLKGHTFSTVAKHPSFKIKRVVSTKWPASQWTIDITYLSSGNTDSIYITDILRVYTCLVSSYWDASGSRWATKDDIQACINKHCIKKAQSSCMMALLATFDDIEPSDNIDPKTRKKCGIRYVPH